jgi:hypothetical protein
MELEYPLRVWTHTDGDYHHGWTQNDENSPQLPWMKLTVEAHTRVFWFLQPPVELFQQWGWEELTSKRYDELQSFFDSEWVRGINYIYYATNGDAESFKPIVNWLLGPISEILNEWEVSGSAIWDILHPSELSEIYSVFRTNGFIKSKAKDAIHDLMHGFTIDTIRNDPDYWAGDDSELDKLIQSVYEDNKDTILAGNPDKIGNWLVGQVMKASRGKADPAAVRGKVVILIKDTFA